MTNSDPRHEELVGWLKNQGHSPTEIEKILARLADYDQQTMHESVFDSISSGKFDIATIIQEALGEEDESNA